MLSTFIFLVTFHLLILQASAIDLDTSLSLGHKSTPEPNKSPDELYQFPTSEEPNLELSLTPGKSVIHNSHSVQEKKPQSSALDFLSMQTISTKSPIEIDLGLSLSLNNPQENPVTPFHQRNNLGSLESPNLPKSWLRLGSHSESLDSSTVGSTQHGKLPIGSVKSGESQMLYQITGPPHPYSVSNAIYPPQFHHTNPEQRLTMGPFTSQASKTAHLKNTIQLQSPGWASAKRTADQASIESDLVSQRFKQQRQASGLYKQIISEIKYPQHDQTFRTFPSNPSTSTIESSEMSRRLFHLRPQPVLISNPEGSQSPVEQSPETPKLEHIWLRHIERMGKQLIDVSPSLPITSWLDVLKNDLKELSKTKSITPIFKGYDIPRAIARAKERFSATLLGCLQLLHQGNNQFQPSEPSCQLDGSVHDGWLFIQRILNPWRSSLTTPLASIIPPSKVNKIAGMQPIVLFFYLSRGGYAPIGIQYLWTFWKKWYRESSLPNKRFLGTCDHFVHAIGTSLKPIGDLSIPHHKWLRDSNMVLLDEEITHQDLLDQHCLQSAHLSRLSIDKAITQGDMVTLAVYVGKFEVQLLEHHEAVEEYFDELSEELQTDLYKIGSQTLVDCHPSIVRLVANMYRKITLPFLGTLRMLHGNDLTSKAKVKDPTISNGWRFIKTLIDQSKNINIFDLIRLEHPITPNETHCPQQLYDLSKRMLTLGDTSNILIPQLWELYTQWAQSSAFATEESKQLTSKAFEQKLKTYYARMHLRSHQQSRLGRGIYRN